MTPVQKLLPERYRWEQSKIDPSILQRRGVGAETIVGLQKPNSEGQYDLYYRVTMRTSPESVSLSPNLSKIKKSFEITLQQVRRHHPEIACTVTWDSNYGHEPIIQYKSPPSDADAVKWARECVHVLATSQNALDLRTLRVKQRSLTNPGPSSAITIYILGDVADQTYSLLPNTQIDVLIHLNHLFWDGMGVRMLVGDILRGVGKNMEVNSTTAQNIPWGQETANLPHPLLNIGTIDPRKLDADFEDWWSEYIENMMKSTAAHGFGFTTTTGTPRTLFHTFSETDSAAMMRNIKNRLGPGYTISHLGNSALLLALLKMKPLPPNYPTDEPFVMTVPVNGRRWLQHDVANNFYIMAQTGAVIRFNDVKSLEVDLQDRPAVVEALERACRDAKFSYDRWLNNPFQGILGIMKDNLTAEYLQSTPILYREQAAPFFISDGVNDRWVPGQIMDPYTGKVILSVEDVAFFLDQYLPYMAVRLDSFKGRSALSLCYNDGHYTNEIAATYLRLVADYMVAFA